MDLSLLDQTFPRLDPSSLLKKRGLTPREVEILEWLSLEKTNNEGGLHLGISQRTVAKHIENIQRKLGVKSRTGAVVQFLRLTLRTL